MTGEATPGRLTAADLFFFFLQCQERHWEIREVGGGCQTREGKAVGLLWRAGWEEGGGWEGGGDFNKY